MLKPMYRAVRSIIPERAHGWIEKQYIRLLIGLPLKQRIAVQYYKSFGSFPNFDNPRTFSEKCQARKLKGEDLAPYVDKVLVKDFVTERIGAEYVIPTLYEGKALPPRPERKWPFPYVIKTNHGSGGNFFVREEPDWVETEERIAAFLRYDFGVAGGEMFYGNVERKVLVEPLISTNGQLPLDYKFFVFDGKPEFVQVHTTRETIHRRVIFDCDWNRLGFSIGDTPVETRPVERPSRLEEMLELASILGRGFGFVRVDLYQIGERIYFGEMTFTPNSGFMRFVPPEMDMALGARWPWPS